MRLRTRALMVDVDGVLLVHPHARGWASGLQAALGLSPDLLHEHFFAPHWQDIIVGRAGLHERLTPVLAGIAPHLSPAMLTDFWFREDAHVDAALLREIDGVRAAGMEVHLATVQEHERASFLWTNLGLAKHFDAMHYAAQLGFAKPDPAFFRAIEKATGFNGAELAFIDDKPDNVAAAQQCGWRAAVWTGGQTLREVLAGLAVSAD